MTIITSATSPTTAQTIINGALRLLQVASSDVILTADESNDALEALNQMIDGWSNDSLMLYHVEREQFTCVPGLNPHTIGLGGDFNTSVPMNIEAATVSVGGIDYPIISINYDDYAVIKLKTLNNVYPEYLYFDRKSPYLANIYMYPVPSTPSILNLYSRKPLSNFASLVDSVDLPVGYARALKYCLAVEIAPEYQVTAGDDVMNLAISSKAGIKRTNKRQLTMQIDPAALAINGKTRFNIYTGQ